MKELTVENIKTVKERLRELKEEWISSKPGRGSSKTQYIGKDTVVQILEYATHGITTWDFEIVEQWKEEVNTKLKGTNQWQFDGFVYHVKGRLTIDGFGSRMQFGKKVAEGGVNNQDSAYQAAASTCLSKCASMFGVGEKLYVKNQISNEDDFMEEINQQQQFQQQQPVEQMMGQPQQQQQAVWQQQQSHPNNPNSWGGQEQAYQQPQMQQQQTQQPVWGGQETQQQQPQWANNNTPVDWSQEVSHTNATYQNETVPFNNAQVQQQQPQNNVFLNQAQGGEQVQNNQPTPVVMGAPVEVPPTPNQPQTAPEPISVPQGSDQQQLFMEQISIYNNHRGRLGHADDSGMTPYLRDFFKLETADTSLLNMETIVGFNQYMNTIQA